MQTSLNKADAVFRDAKRANAFVEKALDEVIVAKDKEIARANSTKAKLGVLSVENELTTQALLVEKVARADVEQAFVEA